MIVSGDTRASLRARATRAAGTRPLLNRHPRATLLIGAAATLAAVAWAIVLLSPASDHTGLAPSSAIASDVPVTTLAARSETVPTLAQAAGHSMVQLRAVTSHGVVSLVGVAVAEGGLVATTADALSGLRSISMVASDGRTFRASLVGVDTASDVALVSVPDAVPVAPFADDAALSTGNAVMTLSVESPTAADGHAALRGRHGDGSRHRDRQRVGQGDARDHLDGDGGEPTAGRPPLE